jgi:hypothetical protein
VLSCEDTELIGRLLSSIARCAKLLMSAECELVRFDSSFEGDAMTAMIEREPAAWPSTFRFVLSLRNETSARLTRQSMRMDTKHAY